jgi:hypothetical protein
MSVCKRQRQASDDVLKTQMGVLVLDYVVEAKEQLSMMSFYKESEALAKKVRAVHWYVGNMLAGARRVGEAGHHRSDQRRIFRSSKRN